MKNDVPRRIDVPRADSGRSNPATVYVSGTASRAGDVVPNPHPLDSHFHTGTLRTDQAPQFITNDGSRAWLGAAALIGPSSHLVEAVGPLANTLRMSTGPFVVGDVLKLWSRGQIEWVRVLVGPELNAGVYFYTVARDLAGTSPLYWEANDTVFGTQRTDEGWVEIASETDSQGGAGPAVVGFMRHGSEYDSFAPRWVIGNLNGRYDYTVDTFGVAFGHYGPAGIWWGIDDANGIRLMQGDTSLSQWDNLARIRLGPLGKGHIILDPNELQIKFFYGDKPLAAFDAESLAMYGFQIWGNPLGPALRIGTVDEGTEQQRFVFRIIGFEGVPVFSIATGTAANPDDAVFRIGKADATSYLNWEGGELTVRGNIEAVTGYLQDLSVTGTLTIDPAGQIVWGNAQGVMDATGLRHIDGTNVFRVAPDSSALVLIEGNTSSFPDGGLLYVNALATSAAAPAVYAVHGGSYYASAVVGKHTNSGYGLYGTSDSGTGAYGLSITGIGVSGINNATPGSPGGVGVRATGNAYSDAALQVIGAPAQVDTIAEYTTAAGITIDGVLLKDSTVRIGGNQVVAAQGALIADVAVSGSAEDATARTAINTILARLRAHGLIAT